ncbi:MAG: hypothetical protein QXD24_02000 [Candidatus Caldarchaeum sp.]|jgi:cysteinyl-tRNA synthetase
MITLVSKIAHYSRNVKKISPFYIIVQNGENILDYDKHGIYLSTISGIGVEDLWYDETKPLPSSYTNERIKYLDMVNNSGRPVFSIDYVDDGSGYAGENRRRIEDYISKTRAKGYIPYAARADRELDTLVIIPGVQPRLKD